MRHPHHEITKKTVKAGTKVESRWIICVLCLSFRFANVAMKMNDPLQTLYQLMSGRQPAAVTVRNQKQAEIPVPVNDPRLDFQFLLIGRCFSLSETFALFCSSWLMTSGEIGGRTLQWF